jgi:hypothetical protein
MAVRTINRATVADGPETDRLLGRLELIAQAEEQAAIAEEQSRLAAGLDSETLPCASVLTLAIEQLSRSHAEVCERMAAAAIDEGDVLLARALRALVGSLEATSRHAAVAAIEAHDFGEAMAAEQPESNSAETA